MITKIHLNDRNGKYTEKHQKLKYTKSGDPNKALIGLDIFFFFYKNVFYFKFFFFS